MRSGRPRKDYTEDDKRKDSIAKDIVNSLRMTGLSHEQLKALYDTLSKTFLMYNMERLNIDEFDDRPAIEVNREAIAEFLQSKRVEGKSVNTIYNYGRELEKLFAVINKDYREITSQDIREYMDFRKEHDNVTNVTIANVRMYLMSFYKWATVEEKIVKNPMNKIGVVKKDKKVIETLTDEESEMIRCACENERELAIIDLLAGSGMRVSELCKLNRQDVNFETGEVKVYGKGAKERICFLTGRAKVHIKWYLESRTDDNEALFVTNKSPYKRLTKNGVEYILKRVAQKTGVSHLKLYPHKYRSTLATNMLNKGADITSIQHILGHQSSDTTISCYARMDNSSLKNAHHTYVS